MHPFDLPYDDLAPGLRFATRARTVTEADVVAFATQTGDLHPQHVDAEWSAGGPFGERIAHGLLVLSYAAGLVPFDPDRVRALRRVRDATFKRPVRLGDTIRAEGRIASMTEIDERAGLVTVALTVLGAGGRTVMRASLELVWARDPVPVSEDEPEIAVTGLVHAFTSVPL
jgi:3-hydroxybutyryl-CoA dehydratase